MINSIVSLSIQREKTNKHTNRFIKQIPLIQFRYNFYETISDSFPIQQRKNY